jgi:hypothetical protein
VDDPGAQANHSNQLAVSVIEEAVETRDNTSHEHNVTRGDERVKNRFPIPMLIGKGNDNARIVFDKIVI